MIVALANERWRTGPVTQPLRAATPTRWMYLRPKGRSFNGAASALADMTVLPRRTILRAVAYATGVRPVVYEPDQRPSTTTTQYDNDPKGRGLV